jgi:hypothetical protein
MSIEHPLCFKGDARRIEIINETIKGFNYP